MKIDIIDMEKWIKDSGIKEVTSANIFALKSTEPDPDGLGSYEIFGKPGSYERKNSFGYIDLVERFFHPHVLNVLVSLKKIINDVISGNGEFYIDLKEKCIKKLGEGMNAPDGYPVGSGINFLYDNWDNISFEKEKMSPTVKDRVVFIEKLKKNEIFITKFIVIPPFYRDVDVTAGKKNEINIMYQRIISLSSMLKSSSSFMTFQSVSDAHKKIQDTIMELYNYFVKFTTGNKGFIHLHVMGKPTDFSARMIISTPTINAETPDDMEVSFSHSAIPLHIVLKCFAPFIVREFRRMVIDKLGGSKFLYQKTKTSYVRYELADHFTEELMSENIYKLIDLYYDSKEHRLDYFTLLGANEERLPFMYKTIEGQIVSNGSDEFTKVTSSSIRPMMLCELFYVVAMNAVKDKYIEVTRYPVEDYHNIYPTKMNIIPCHKYKKTIIENIEYPRFPIIDHDNDIKKVDSMFTDTLRLFPTYLAALGADFDGDMVSIQGVWGNNEADEFIYSKKNIVNIGGGTMRTTKDITPHTIFALTRKETSNGEAKK